MLHLRLVPHIRRKVGVLQHLFELADVGLQLRDGVDGGLDFYSNVAAPWLVVAVDVLFLVPVSVLS